MEFIDFYNQMLKKSPPEEQAKMREDFALLYHSWRRRFPTEPLTAQRALCFALSVFPRPCIFVADMALAAGADMNKNIREGDFKLPYPLVAATTLGRRSVIGWALEKGARVGVPGFLSNKIFTIEHPTQAPVAIAMAYTIAKALPQDKLPEDYQMMLQYFNPYTVDDLVHAGAKPWEVPANAIEWSSVFDKEDVSLASSLIHAAWTDPTATEKTLYTSTGKPAGRKESGTKLEMEI
jgi:hypothetical protein